MTLPTGRKSNAENSRSSCALPSLPANLAFGRRPNQADLDAVGLTYTQYIANGGPVGGTGRQTVSALGESCFLTSNTRRRSSRRGQTGYISRVIYAESGGVR